MPFAGFTPETSQFLWDLAFHNERPWFNAHKEQFLRVLKEPFDALGRETLDLLQAGRPDLPWQLHVSRIYRDARRLYGRGPYKDHLGVTIWGSVEKHDNPAFWFEISGAGWEYGVGLFAPESGRMEDYRRYILEHTAEMEKLARRLEGQSVFRLTGADYKRPKGDVGPVLNPWYNKKWVGISAAYDFEGALLTPELPRILAEGYGFLMPYYDLLRRFAPRSTENFSDFGQ